jgi:hypothetical protein
MTWYGIHMTWYGIHMSINTLCVDIGPELDVSNVEKASKDCFLYLPVYISKVTLLCVFASQTFPPISEVLKYKTG